MKILIKHILLYFYFTTSILLSQQNFSGIVDYKSFTNSKKIEKLLSEKKQKTKNKKLLSLIKQSFEFKKPINSKLQFSNNKGVFIVEDKMIRDDDLGQQMAVSRAGGSKEYYYNDNEKIYLIKECEALGECFVFDNKFLKWNLTQETKEMNGYKVFKATRSNGKVIAWYTPSIPISFGPKGEYGLPGLILELEIGKIIFRATKIILNPKEKVVVERPKGGNRVSYEEYSSIMKKAKKSVFGN
ncbi:GLPGLI family protein [Polaribacter sp. R77954]|uniref:GLPGLI family protein n=1 Tax=Polaribacter sp. R77954 TaxID=3093870 RepID=UPI0037C8FA7D